MALNPLYHFFIYLTCAVTVTFTVYWILPAANSAHWLANHTFVSAHDDQIQYHGRWLSSPNRLVRSAGFDGSSFDFTVFNTSIVILSLSSDEKHTKSSALVHEYASSLVVVSALMKTIPAAPVDLVITINGTLVSGVSSAFKHVLLASDLNPVNPHHVSVRLNGTAAGGEIQVEGLYLSRDSTVFHPSRTPGLQAAIAKDNFTSTQTIPNIAVPDATQKVEVMLPAYLQGEAGGGGTDWLDQLGRLFPNTSFTSIPLKDDFCITCQCQIQGKDDTSSSIPLSSDTFFRAGPPNTALYSLLWPFGSGNSLPAALILMLGYQDVEATIAPGALTKHKANQFTQDFARRYASFLQTIRRTAYSPSTLASIRPKSQFPLAPAPEQDSDDELDESYLYNSSPSTVPIFLVLQPLPSYLLLPQSREIRNILHHATSKVLSELKWHIGDKHTFVIDTAGWLPDEDFRALTKTGKDATLPTFGLTQRGHARFAHSMSVHLCHYLRDPTTDEQCSFDRHGEYTGNLYVPDVAGIGKVMEEKKIEKIKEMFGINEIVL